MSNKKIPMNLKRGRKVLDKYDDIEILQDFKWDSNKNRWYLKLELTSDFNGIIPKKSLWYLIAQDDYPRGNIRIYPDSKTGFNETYEHQSNNGVNSDNDLWKSGNLCLDSQFKDFNLIDSAEEQDVDKKILWNVDRAIKWINALNTNSLINAGDSFELPQFNCAWGHKFIFMENYDTFIKWNEIKSKKGYITNALFENDTFDFFITNEFKNENDDIILKLGWGTFLYEEMKEFIDGMWFLLDEIPVLNHWQAPNTFNELIRIFENEKRDFLSEFKTLVYGKEELFRDNENHLIIVGFPIPEKIGNENKLIHWQAFLFQFNCSKTCNPPINFMPNKNRIYLKKDKLILSSDENINWIDSQNWSENKILNRGSLSQTFKSKNVLVIGVGTIGSVISDLIVHEGIKDITLIDNDNLEIGNLSRYNLTLNELHKPKSKEFSRHLNKINPFTNANGIFDTFVYDENKTLTYDEYDMIIDCTGENQVLYDLEKFEFEHEKIFISVSIGINADNVYLLLQKGTKFNVDKFIKDLQPFMEENRMKLDEMELPRDGTKCWMPVFPVKYHDIMSISSLTVKIIEKFIESNEKEWIKFYSKEDSSDAVGYKLIEF